MLSHLTQYNICIYKTINNFQFVIYKINGTSLQSILQIQLSRRSSYRSVVDLKLFYFITLFIIELKGEVKNKVI